LKTNSPESSDEVKNFPVSYIEAAVAMGLDPNEVWVKEHMACWRGPVLTVDHLPEYVENLTSSSATSRNSSSSSAENSWEPGKEILSVREEDYPDFVIETTVRAMWILEQEMREFAKIAKIVGERGQPLPPGMRLQISLNTIAQEVLMHLQEWASEEKREKLGLLDPSGRLM
jgi:hypothetical protein